MCTQTHTHTRGRESCVRDEGVTIMLHVGRQVVGSMLRSGGRGNVLGLEEHRFPRLHHEVILRTESGAA